MTYTIHKTETELTQISLEQWPVTASRYERTQQYHTSTRALDDVTNDISPIVRCLSEDCVANAGGALSALKHDTGAVKERLRQRCNL